MIKVRFPPEPSGMEEVARMEGFTTCECVSAALHGCGVVQKGEEGRRVTWEQP